MSISINIDGKINGKIDDLLAALEHTDDFEGAVVNLIAAASAIRILMNRDDGLSVVKPVLLRIIDGNAGTDIKVVN